MNSATAPESSKLTPTVSGFVLAAAVTVLFNTALALAKEAYPPLNNFMKSVAGHHWTTHGLADLVVFIGLGFVFTKTPAVQNMDANRLTAVLIASVAIAALVLAGWYAFF